MLKSVKKIRDRIFSASTNRKDNGYDDGSESPGIGPGSASPKLVTPRAGRGPSFDAPGPELVPTTSVRNRTNSNSDLLVPAGRRNSQSLRQGGHESPLSSPHGGVHAAVLPPVQINSNSNSFTAQQSKQAGYAMPGAGVPGVHGGVPVNLGTLLSPAGANGRRKSTPAALDMALRTAEGKAAVEELLNQGQSKKLVFGNYFAGTHGANKEQQQLAKAAAKQAGLPKLQQQAPGMAAAQKPTLAVLQVANHSSEKGMASVPEDAAMEDAPMHPSAGKAAPVDSASSLQDAAMAVSPSGGAPQAMAQPPPPPPPPQQQQQQQHHQPPPQHHAPPVPQQQAPPKPTLGTLPAGISPTTVAMATAAAAAPAVMAPGGRPTRLLTLSPALPASMQRSYWCLADYNIIRKMYTGYASTVYQAMCKKSLEMVALKVYHMENLCELNHYQVYREIRVHQSLQHQNVIHLFASFKEGNDVVLVQEYAEGGDLYRLLHKNGGRLSERQAVEMVLHPFLLAMHYLHTRGIMHRDIKPENVLFTEHRVLKLADFGLAIDLTEERAVTRAGTLDYMAPEVLRCPPKNLPQENKNNPYLHYNNSVDAWAVGVFAYELIVGFPPFAGENQLDSVDKIMHAVPEFPDRISELAKDFICQALRKHPGDRPTVMEMLHHPWIRLYQRRTSMRISLNQTRRRSSVTYGSNPMYTPPQEAAEEGTDGAEPMDMDVGEMTPEQIESMIAKLQG